MANSFETPLPMQAVATLNAAFSAKEKEYVAQIHALEQQLASEANIRSGLESHLEDLKNQLDLRTQEAIALHADLENNHAAATRREAEWLEHLRTKEETLRLQHKADLEAALNLRVEELTRQHATELASRDDAFAEARMNRESLLRTALDEHRDSYNSLLSTYSHALQTLAGAAAWKQHQLKPTPETLQTPHDAKEPWDMLIGSPEAPHTSIHTLLQLSDLAFVRAAYWTLLNRAPDPDGLAYFVQRVRTGYPLLDILAEMRHSPEGLQHQPSVDGLEEAIADYRRALRKPSRSNSRCLEGFTQADWLLRVLRSLLPRLEEERTRHQAVMTLLNR